MPDDIPHENLYGIAWNPVNTIAVLQRIDGAATARRVGTDALSPAFAQLLPMAFPNAELVDGELAMRAARRIKTPEEVVALRDAIAVAEAGLAAGVAELHPGVREQALAGIMMEAMAAGGVSTPANQDFAWVTSPDHPWRRVGDGDGRRRTTATWWHSPPGCSPAATSARSDGPGRWATSAAPMRCYRRWDDLWARLDCRLPARRPRQ